MGNLYEATSEEPLAKNRPPWRPIGRHRWFWCFSLFLSSIHFGLCIYFAFTVEWPVYVFLFPLGYIELALDKIGFDGDPFKVFLWVTNSLLWGAAATWLLHRASVMIWKQKEKTIA